MKAGDLVRIKETLHSRYRWPLVCLAYPDDVSEDWAGAFGNSKCAVGRLAIGTPCIYLEEQRVGEVTFYRVIAPAYGPVWVQAVWIGEAE